MIPQARTEHTVACATWDALVVYEIDRQRLHFLNRTATLVWQHCDGKTSVREISGILQARLRLPADEDLVWLALDCLARSGLLEQSPSEAEMWDRCSRWEVGRRLGLDGSLAGLLPAITVIEGSTERDNTPLGDHADAVVAPRGDA